MKRITALILSLVLIFCMAPGVFSESAFGNLVLQGYDNIAENNNFAFFAEEKSGKIALMQKKDGYVWYSNPDTDDDTELGDGKKRLMESQLEIKYYDTKSMLQERVSSVACTAKNGLSAKKTKNGILFEYFFADDGITVPLQYVLKSDCLSVSVIPDSVKEENGNILSKISVLPYFGAANTNESGYFFVPDGSGSLINFNNGKSNCAAYEQKIYGEDIVAAAEKQSTNIQSCAIPVIGISKQNYGVIAVASSGEAFASANAYVAGMKKNYNAAYFSFDYRASDTVILDSTSQSAKKVVVNSEKPAQCKSFTVDIYPLDDGCTYSDMAKKYRSVLLEKGLLYDSKQDTDVAFFVNSYGAVEKQGSFLWIPVKVMKPLTTYKDAAKMMLALKDSGIKNMVFSYEGWSAGGITGKLQTAGKYESVLGSKKDFQSLIKTASDNRIVFLPELETVNFYKSGNGYMKSSSTAKTLNNSPALQYRYSPWALIRDTSVSPYFLLSPAKYSVTLEKFMKSYKLDVAGISVKNLGSRLYYDGGRDNFDRSQVQQTVCNTLSQIKSNAGMVMTKASNIYAALLSDYIIDAPSADSAFDITDKSVPFYQIVLSGYKSYSTGSVNLGSSTTETLLKSIETGAGLYFDFNARNFHETQSTPIENVYNSNYQDWIDLAADQYRQVNEIYHLTGNHIISDHYELSDGVFVTEFENSVKVIVNYSESDYASDGISVGSMDYFVLR